MYDAFKMQTAIVIKAVHFYLLFSILRRNVAHEFQCVNVLRIAISQLPCISKTDKLRTLQSRREVRVADVI